MWEHKLAYRFQNGEVMGFVGTGFNKEDAVKACMIEIRYKVKDINKQEFIPSCVISDMKEVSKDEFDQIKKDWKTYRSFFY